MRLSTFVSVAMVLTPIFGVAQEGQDRLRTAFAFEEDSNFAAALRDYELIVASDVPDEVRLEASLRIGRIRLEELGEPLTALEYFEDGARALQFPDIASRSGLYLGKAILATARRDEDFTRALEEFDRVIRTLPPASGETVSESLLTGGRILARQHQLDRASLYYQSLVTDYPDSAFAPAAFLELSRMLARQGQVVEALEAYQSIQRLYEGDIDLGEIAGAARREATLLYRLRFLNQTDPQRFESLVTPETDAFRLDDPRQLLWQGADGLLILDDDRTFSVAAPDGTPRTVDSPNLPDCTDGRDAFRIDDERLVLPDNTVVEPHYARPNRSELELFDEILACHVELPGGVVISTRGPNGVHRVDLETGATEPFFPLDVRVDVRRIEKIRVDPDGNFYLFDTDEEVLFVTRGNGQQIATLDRRALGIEEMRDFDLDTLGNLYLLDEEGQFLIFESFGLANRTDQPIVQNVIDPSDGEPIDNLRAIAVTDVGSVYVVGRNELIFFD